MGILSAFNKLIHLGTDRISKNEIRKDIVLINISCFFGAGICLLTFLISYGSSNHSYQLLNLITGTTCLLPIWANYYNYHFFSKAIVVWVIPSLMPLYIYLFGNMGADYYIMVGMVVGIYFFRQNRWGIVLTVSISGMSFLLSKMYLWKLGFIRIDGIGEYLYFPNLFFCMVAIGWLTERFRSYYVRQNRHIKALHESRGRLISVLSHDLRSPLNNLQYLIDEFRSVATDKERQEIVLGMVADSLKSTSLLLDNATYWINSEGDQLKARSEKLQLSDLISENIELFEPVAAHKGLKIECQTEGNHAIIGDRNIIKMILRNLLSNAIKFTPVNGETIKVIVKADQEKIWLGVKDAGRGMEPGEMNFLQASNRQSNPGTSNETGTGMGLVLIKYFLELITSELQLESNKNEGTTIYFSLQLASDS